MTSRIDRSTVLWHDRRARALPWPIPCSAWTVAPLKMASAEELATNRVKDLTLGSVASLAGFPQVSVPVVGEGYAIGLGLLATAGSDARLLALAESLTD